MHRVGQVGDGEGEGEGEVAGRLDGWTALGRCRCRRRRRLADLRLAFVSGHPYEWS